MSETAEWGNVCSRVDTCALTGAAAFFTGIKGAEVLVNGPLWCYFYALRHLEKSNSRLGERFMARSRIIMRSFMEQKNV